MINLLLNLLCPLKNQPVENHHQSSSATERRSESQQCSLPASPALSRLPGSPNA